MNLDMATSVKAAESSDGQTFPRLAVAPSNIPRLIKESDCEWMLELGKRRYSNEFDFQATELWFRNLVMRGPLMFLPMRTDNSFCISMLSTTPWRPSDPECNVALVAAEADCMWEAIALLRESIAWAKRRKCRLWRISSETGYDLRAIATRLGATSPDSRWVLKFDG